MAHYAIVDDRGFVIDEVVVEEYDAQGKPISDPVPDNYIPPNYTKRLFTPRWDFTSQEWVEGLSTEEVAAKEREISGESKPSELDRLRQENEMNAMAMMELAELVMEGGI